MRRRHFLQALLAAPPIAAGLSGRRAAAAPFVWFTQPAFAAAQAAGKPILVDVWASWCPVCAKQAPTLAAVETDPAFGELSIFKVNFDTQKDVLRAFGVQKQSTLIAFHGAREIGRATGITAPEEIRALLASALVPAAG
jgi:thioredoxin-like negative regulator of GroEL